MFHKLWRAAGLYQTNADTVYNSLDAVKRGSREYGTCALIRFDKLLLKTRLIRSRHAPVDSLMLVTGRSASNGLRYTGLEDDAILFEVQPRSFAGHPAVVLTDSSRIGN
jgi:hypothetical protein